jgi:predicted patatin/cPLA2 family phospholipase
MLAQPTPGDLCDFVHDSPPQGTCPVMRSSSSAALKFLRAAIFAWMSFGIVLTGCATPPRSPPMTIQQAKQVFVLGIPNARFKITDNDGLTREFVSAAQREITSLRDAGHVGQLPPANFLAVSGGGDNGAYGAGLLIGWTARGDRPVFKAVTGVSTGALTAPFAFLGSDYDPQLKAVYTTTNADRIFKKRNALAAINNDAMNDTRPLHDLVASYVDDRMVTRFAEEYAKGRLLLIMTSNMDAGEPCIWNIGAIAASGKPGAREMIVKILMASSAIPGVFPPVMLNFEVNGVQYQEMHADGGVFAQAFLYPAHIDVAEAANLADAAGRLREAYVIRNGQLFEDPITVKRRTVNIAARAVAMMITTSGLNDMYRIYATTNRDHVGYHVAYIGDDFTEPYKGPFDEGYMSKLFQYGYKRGLAGDEWSSKPPGWAD